MFMDNFRQRVHLDAGLLLDILLQRIRQALVKLPGSAYNASTSSNCAGMLKLTCCNTRMASWGGISPCVMSSSSESVRAVPMLRLCQHPFFHSFTSPFTSSW